MNEPKVAFQKRLLGQQRPSAGAQRGAVLVISNEDRHEDPPPPQYYTAPVRWYVEPLIAVPIVNTKETHSLRRTEVLVVDDFSSIT